MREIKFRAWYKDRNKWCSDWSISSYEELLDLNEEMNYQNVILLQYTGLKDKNGKEIYEGDVLEYWDELKRTDGSIARRGETKKGIIKWLDYGWGWHKCGTPWDYEGLPYGEIIVIGNIYDNPELVGGSYGKVEVAGDSRIARQSGGDAGEDRTPERKEKATPEANRQSIS